MRPAQKNQPPQGRQEIIKATLWLKYFCGGVLWRLKLFVPVFFLLGPLACYSGAFYPASYGSTTCPTSQNEPEVVFTRPATTELLGVLIVPDVRDARDAAFLSYIRYQAKAHGAATAWIMLHRTQSNFSSELLPLPPYSSSNVVTTYHTRHVALFCDSGRKDRSRPTHAKDAKQICAWAPLEETEAH